MLEQSKTTKEIDDAFFRIMTKAPAIKKKSDNDYYKSKYAEYPDIQEALKPLFIEEKLLVKFFPVEGNKLILIITHLTSQEFFKSTMDLNSISSTPQAQGSAISYMKRYSIAAAFDLIIEGDDDDGNAGSAKRQTNEQTSAAPKNKDDGAKSADPNRPYLNPETQQWFDTKIWLFNKKGATIEGANFNYRITKDNQSKLRQPEVLKPGNKYWPLATVYLNLYPTPAGKAAIAKAFEVSDADFLDLMTDATNYTPAETPQSEAK